MRINSIMAGNTAATAATPHRHSNDYARTAIAGERLSLSEQARVAAFGSEATLPQTDFVRTLMHALSGSDPDLFKVFYLKVQAQAAQEIPVTRPGGEMLQRILIGTLHDQQHGLLACSVSLRFNSQVLASDWGRSLALSPQGVPTPFSLQAEMPLREFLGTQLRFECMADMRGLWPLQAQLINGLVRFGSDIEGPRRQKERQPQSQAGPEQSQSPAPPPAPEADDNPVPRISASRWMELSMFGWMTQLFSFVPGLFGRR